MHDIDAQINARDAAGRLIRRNVERIRRLEQWSKGHRTLGDRIADRIAQGAGRIGFVWVHAALFAGWIAWNVLPHFPHFDPYPFTFLTLCVSLEAIFLSGFILISQSQEAKLADRRTLLDLQINLLSEQENTKILALLHAIALKMGALEEDDPEIAALAEAVRPETIGQEIEAAFPVHR
jgi:uncharacterized membrane protein